MAIVLDFEKFKDDLKKEVKKRKIDKALKTVWDYRYEIAGAIAFGLMTANTAGKMIDKANEKSEEGKKIYDPKEGHYWRTKRKLTNKEYLEMSEIKKQYGCNKGEALKIMGLLKK